MSKPDTIEPLRPYVQKLQDAPTVENLIALLTETYHLASDTERAACAALAGDCAGVTDDAEAVRRAALVMRISARTTRLAPVVKP